MCAANLRCPLKMEAKKGVECTRASEFEAQYEKSGSTANKQRQSMAPPFSSKHAVDCCSATVAQFTLRAGIGGLQQGHVGMIFSDVALRRREHVLRRSKCMYYYDNDGRRRLQTHQRHDRL